MWDRSFRQRSLCWRAIRRRSLCWRAIRQRPLRKWSKGGRAVRWRPLRQRHVLHGRVGRGSSLWRSPRCGSLGRRHLLLRRRRLLGDILGEQSAVGQQPDRALVREFLLLDSVQGRRVYVGGERRFRLLHGGSFDVEGRASAPGRSSSKSLGFGDALLVLRELGVLGGERERCR